ncbi:hypothetical protein [Rhodococcoides kyotonense]|uniref:Uncharacterized protein n=1 Tax=Rhodococcoides kyotonense TaxID=398843 RepID=A0A239FQW4_9NOCA|nr:hypothetical protein [Rhodococcus kyotonensis]SNS59466.1 hypothetical protein SAMN05421642_103422 [Rhodococcus kyotonensis]
MKRHFHYFHPFDTEGTFVGADRCDILPGGVLAFGRDDGYLILAVAAGRWTQVRELDPKDN